MKKKILVLSVLFIFVLAIKAFALGLVNVEVAGGVWMESLSGDFSYKGDSLNVDDLGYDKEYKFCGRVKLDLPLINIYAAYAPVHFEGDGNLAQAFNFAGKTFNASLPFHSSLTMDQYDVGIYFGIPFLKKLTKAATLGFSGLNFEFGAILKVMEVEGSIKQSTANLEASIEPLTVPLPVGYLGMEVDFFWITLEGEFKGIKYKDTHYYDLTGRVKVFLYKTPVLGPSVFISGGYRYQDFAIDYSDFKTSLKLSGPFAEVGIKF